MTTGMVRNYCPSWLALGTVGNAWAHLPAADVATRLYFKPNAGFKGTIATAVTFRAWDRTGGVNGALITTAANGGATTFSATADTASIVVT